MTVDPLTIGHIMRALIIKDLENFMKIMYCTFNPFCYGVIIVGAHP